MPTAGLTHNREPLCGSLLFGRYKEDSGGSRHTPFGYVKANAPKENGFNWENLLVAD